MSVAVVLATRGCSAPRRVALPHVVGTSVGTAASALRARGFRVRIAAGAHASEPRGTVAAVRPSGTSAAQGATVALVPSSGPPAIAIPPVSGFSQPAAVAALERLGLAVQPQTAYNPAPSGTVVATTPRAGVSVPPHSSVVLTISAGPAPPVPAEPTSPPGTANGNGNGDGHGNAYGHDKHQDNGGGD